MADSKKPLSEYDASQVLQKAFSNEGTTLGVDGFVSGLIGRMITRNIINATTDDFVYSENSTNLMTIRVIYTDGAHSDIVSVQRTA